MVRKELLLTLRKLQHYSLRNRKSWMKFLIEGNESERLIFRKIQESDFDQWLEFFKDPRASEHWIEERETPQIECAKWYMKQFWRYENDQGGMNALIEKESGKLVGHCG